MRYAARLVQGSSHSSFPLSLPLSGLPTASFLACTRTPCIIRVLACIYMYSSYERTRLDGEQGLTADGLGTPFARAQPRLGKHPQNSLYARICLCIYCTTHERCIDGEREREMLRSRNRHFFLSRINAEIVTRVSTPNNRQAQTAHISFSDFCFELFFTPSLSV